MIYYPISINLQTHITQTHNLKIPQKPPYLTLILYIILSILNYFLPYLYHSAPLTPHTLNNITHIILSLPLIIPFKISIKPPHKNHPYPHLKSQNISTLLLSFIIIFLRIQLLIQNFPPIFSPPHPTPNPITIYLTVITPLIMIIFP
ncbi:cation transporter, partial [Staphylococcus saprophyticus]|uniref:cation transporter n=1 Tax=Staphylococcus saprophyticus TaxID=29385 RepID=UPI002981B9F9